MTVTEACALAILGAGNRRLMAAVIRELSQRASEEDRAALAAREPDEALIPWACRCHASARGRGAVRLDPRAVEREAETQLACGRRLGLEAVSLGDVRYPFLLAAIPDPPPVLWVRGSVPVLARPAVAIVGSRAATAYGLAMARRLAWDLAAAGTVVVSGLARGVDSAAHAGAIGARGCTIAVLGSGLDRVYPPEHRDLAAEIVRDGAVVSEFPPGVPPLKHHFPLRNRLISGLASAVVVVEAPLKSGALITASSALEQGRDVLVVPGQAGGRNRGGHQLIRDGAKVVESADDILVEVGVSSSSGPARDVDPSLDRLLEVADFTVDDVAQRTGEPAAVVLARLLELELHGKVQRVGGGRFVRVR
jgi:DNA processing protein